MMEGEERREKGRRMWLLMTGWRQALREK